MGLELFFQEAQSKVHLMPENSYEQVDDKDLVRSLLEKAEARTLLEDIENVARYIRTIMAYHGVKFIN